MLRLSEYHVSSQRYKSIRKHIYSISSESFQMRSKRKAMYFFFGAPKDAYSQTVL